ncbi:MAG: thioredoxin family protein [Fidelibacterota bacterium]
MTKNKTSDTLELLYLSTPGCRVCQALRPQVESLVNATPPWTFAYVNLEAEPAQKGRWLVFAVPTLILLVNGTEVRRFSRFIHLDELSGFLQRYTAAVDEG